MNLVVNARDAMPSGGKLTIETGIIEIGSEVNHPHTELEPGTYASLRVSDTGKGISAVVKEKLFEPFFTTKGLGQGTGLGLAVVHGVVKQSGGSISVDSSDVVGTSFSILLPFAAGDHASKSIVNQPGDLRGAETVLVVEDEESVRKLIKFALEGNGYRVVTATDGNEALDALEKYRHVDLLVTDVIMPGMNGRELAEKFRAKQADLKVLYMSGYTDDALQNFNLSKKSDQFIQKPFSPLSLIRVIRTLLDQKFDKALLFADS